MAVPALLGNKPAAFHGYLGYSKKKLGKPPGAGECSLLVIEFLDGIEGCTRIELTEGAEGCWLGKSSWQLSTRSLAAALPYSLNRPMQQNKTSRFVRSNFLEEYRLELVPEILCLGRFKPHRSHANSDTGSTAGTASRIFSQAIVA